MAKKNGNDTKKAIAAMAAAEKKATTGQMKDTYLAYDPSSKGFKRFSRSTGKEVSAIAAQPSARVRATAATFVPGTLLKGAGGIERKGGGPIEAGAGQQRAEFRKPPPPPTKKPGEVAALQKTTVEQLTPGAKGVYDPKTKKFIAAGYSLSGKQPKFGKKLPPRRVSPEKGEELKKEGVPRRSKYTLPL